MTAKIKETDIVEVSAIEQAPESEAVQEAPQPEPEPKEPVAPPAPDLAGTKNLALILVTFYQELKAGGIDVVQAVELTKQFEIGLVNEQGPALVFRFRKL